MKKINIQSQYLRQQQSNKNNKVIFFVILLFCFAYHTLRDEIEETMFLIRVTFAHLFLFIH